MNPFLCPTLGSLSFTLKKKQKSFQRKPISFHMISNAILLFNLDILNYAVALFKKITENKSIY